MNTEIITSPCTPTLADPFAAATPEALVAAKRAAWEATRDARNAITQQQLCPLNFDLGVAAIVMVAAARRVAPFRDRLVKALPEFDPRSIDMLLHYTAAMECAHTIFEERKRASLTPAELDARSYALWDRLVRRLATLAEDGLFPQVVIDEVRPGTGWRDRADDLRRLATVGRQYFTQIENNSTLTLEDFAQADVFADAIRVHLGLKSEPVDLTQAQLERHQAITLAYTAYEQVRRAMGWLRWAEKDANKFAPSVHRNEFLPRAKNAAANEGEGDEDEDANNEPVSDETPKPVVTPVEAKKPEPVSAVKRPLIVDKGPMLGPDGEPLVPQDDPFAKD